MVCEHGWFVPNSGNNECPDCRMTKLGADLVEQHAWSEKRMTSQDTRIAALEAQVREKDAKLKEFVYYEDNPDEYQSELERVATRLNDVLNELRCPVCGCADQCDAGAAECGCDEPICARDPSRTLAESYVELRQRCDRDDSLCDWCGEPFDGDAMCERCFHKNAAKHLECNTRIAATPSCDDLCEIMGRSFNLHWSTGRKACGIIRAAFAAKQPDAGAGGD